MFKFSSTLVIVLLFNVFTSNAKATDIEKDDIQKKNITQSTDKELENLFKENLDAMKKANERVNKRLKIGHHKVKIRKKNR